MIFSPEGNHSIDYFAIKWRDNLLSINEMRGEIKDSGISNNDCPVIMVIPIMA
jgi:hypothetical protein